jgi:hypothetical protein
MRNVLLFAATLLLVSCGSTETNTDNSASVSDPSIGFNTMLPELKFHLGTEEAIKIVKELDAAWVARDYEKMKGFFADTAEFYFDDGKIANSPQEFIDKFKAEVEMTDEISWTFDYAFSVDLDPSKGGEHVQAGFTGTTIAEGVESKKRFHESYYVVEGKIVMFTQYSLDVLDEEKE